MNEVVRKGTSFDPAPPPNLTQLRLCIQTWLVMFKLYQRHTIRVSLSVFIDLTVFTVLLKAHKDLSPVISKGTD